MFDILHKKKMPNNIPNKYNKKSKKGIISIKMKNSPQQKIFFKKSNI